MHLQCASPSNMSLLFCRTANKNRENKMKTKGVAKRKGERDERGCFYFQYHHLHHNHHFYDFHTIFYLSLCCYCYCLHLLLIIFCLYCFYCVHESSLLTMCACMCFLLEKRIINVHSKSYWFCVSLPFSFSLCVRICFLISITNIINFSC